MFLIIFLTTVLIILVIVTGNKSIPLYKDVSNYHNQSLSAEILDKIIEDNKQTWRRHQDDHIYLEYPIHMSRFDTRDKESDLFPSDALVSSHYRPSDGTATYGRSFAIILYDTFTNTKKLDVEEWIYSTGKNYSDDGMERYENIVTKTQIDGKEAYSVKYEAELPNFETIYYQTYDGIRAIGYFSFGDRDDITKRDYAVFQDILNTVSFDDHF